MQKYMKHHVLFACPKSTKRTKRGRLSSLKLLPHTRLSRRKYCVASECGRRGRQKNKLRLSPWLYPYHACEHITRTNRADSRMRWFHARIKMCGGRVRSLCADTAEAPGALWQGGTPCRIGMAQSKVEQTTRALEPALLPLPAVGRFTRYVRTGGCILFALW